MPGRERESRNVPEIPQLSFRISPIVLDSAGSETPLRATVSCRDRKAIAYEVVPDRLRQSLEEKLDSLVRSLPLERKVTLLTGADAWGLHPEPAIGLRRMVVSDGPAGVRGVAFDERDTSVSVPSPTSLAASWNEDLVARIGGLLAAEARRKGVDVVLAPTINLHRSPLGGRHFECYSEDPLLTARIGIAYVRGLQDRGVGATLKHYVANDSETERFTLEARIGERALRELYLAPFEQIVAEAGPWLVMAAYNAVNGPTMTESPLLAEPLKGEWGFDGVVVSDWFATRSTDASGRAALDLAMPGPDSPWGEQLVEAVKEGRVPESTVDDKVRRLLRLAARVGALESVPPAAPAIVQPSQEEVAALVREAAAAGMVLLRNVGPLLPLSASSLRRVAVIGPNARDARIQGGGSAYVSPVSSVSPLDGLRATLGAGVEVAHAVGVHGRDELDPLSAAHSADPETGEPGLRLRLLDGEGRVLRSERRLLGRLLSFASELPPGVAKVELAARYRASEPGLYRVGVGGVGHFQLFADDSPILDETIAAESDDLGAAFLGPPQRYREVELAEGQELELRATHEVELFSLGVSLLLGARLPRRSPEQELEQALALAKDADVAIVVVGTNERVESEGWDRHSLALPEGQAELVERVAQANPRTVVVVNSGGPVELPWREKVPAVLLSWFPGQEFGSALADILLGRVEPGGRLPTTWGANQEDVPVLDTQPVDGVLEYREGLHIGYKAWLRAGSEPAYPFGYGLGYTSWEYEGLSLPASAPEGEGVVATVRVRNSGGRRGREVVQVYLSREQSAVERPALWLAGFAGVEAEPGETVEVQVTLEHRAFQYWSADGWRTEPGSYTAHAGRSVLDLRLAGELSVGASG
jgi:beta-glucosidase